jgi:disulfide bond formation protein DsbB
MIEVLGKWQKHWSSWLLLFLSALGLILTALYFQHGLDLRPCVKCINQRTAVFGILFAALIPLIKNTNSTRIVAFVVWGISSISGFLVAREHVDILGASNPFFAPCDIVPKFPSWLPLHEWLPSIFGANGDCFENSWQFFGLGMAEWMMYIFAFYSILLVVVVAAKLIRAR